MPPSAAPSSSSSPSLSFHSSTFSSLYQSLLTTPTPSPSHFHSLLSSLPHNKFPSSPSSSPALLNFLRTYRLFLLTIRSLSSPPLPPTDIQIKPDDFPLSKLLHSYLHYSVKSPHDILQKDIPLIRTFVENKSEIPLSIHLLCQLSHRVGESTSLSLVIQQLILLVEKDKNSVPLSSDQLELECNLLSSWCLESLSTNSSQLSSTSATQHGIPFIQQRLSSSALSSSLSFEWLFNSSILSLSVGDMKTAVTTLQRAISVGKETLKQEGLSADEISQEMSNVITQLSYIYQSFGLYDKAMEVLSSLPSIINDSAVSSVVSLNFDLLEESLSLSSLYSNRHSSSHHSLTSYSALKKSSRILHLDEEKLNSHQRAILHSNRINILWRGKQYEKARGEGEKFLVGNQCKFDGEITRVLVESMVKKVNGKGNNEEAITVLDKFIQKSSSTPSSRCFLPYLRDMDIASLCKSHLLSENNRKEEALKTLNTVEDKVKWSPAMVSWRCHMMDSEQMGGKGKGKGKGKRNEDEKDKGKAEDEKTKLGAEKKNEKEKEKENIIKDGINYWKNEMKSPSSTTSPSLPSLLSPSQCALSLLEFLSTHYIRNSNLPSALSTIQEMDQIQTLSNSNKNNNSEKDKNNSIYSHSILSQCRRVELLSLVSPTAPSIVPLEEYMASLAPSSSASSTVDVEKLLKQGLNSEFLKPKKDKKDKDKDTKDKEKEKEKEREKKIKQMNKKKKSKRMRLPKKLLKALNKHFATEKKQGESSPSASSSLTSASASPSLISSSSSSSSTSSLSLLKKFSLLPSSFLSRHPPPPSDRWIPKMDRPSYLSMKSKSKQWKRDQKRKNKLKSEKSQLRGAQGDASASTAADTLSK